VPHLRDPLNFPSSLCELQAQNPLFHPKASSLPWVVRANLSFPNHLLFEIGGNLYDREGPLRLEHYRQSGLRQLRQLGPSLACGGRNAQRMHAAGLTKSPMLARLVCCSASRHARGVLSHEYSPRPGVPQEPGDNIDLYQYYRPRSDNHGTNVAGNVPRILDAYLFANLRMNGYFYDQPNDLVDLYAIKTCRSGTSSQAMNISRYARAIHCCILQCSIVVNPMFLHSGRLGQRP
jgi:hypothetical protein